MPEKTKEERRAELEAELADLDKPEPSPNGNTRNLNLTIDLGDPEQVKRALKLGLLEKGDLDEFDDPADPAGDPEPADDDPPRRRQRYE